MYFLAVLCIVAAATALPAPDEVHKNLQEPLSSPGPLIEGKISEEERPHVDQDKKIPVPVEKEDRHKEDHGINANEQIFKEMEFEPKSKESKESKNSKEAEISKNSEESKKSKDEMMMNMEKDKADRPDLLPMNDEQKRGLLSSFFDWIRGKLPKIPLPSWRRRMPEFEEQPYYVVEIDPDE